MRSRIVAKDVKNNVQPESSAATPPLGCVRFLALPVASSLCDAEPAQLMVVNVKKACAFAEATRDIYVELPVELGGVWSNAGLLRKSLYGTRDAALNWANTYTSVLADDFGILEGTALPV